MIKIDTTTLSVTETRSEIKLEFMKRPQSWRPRIPVHSSIAREVGIAGKIVSIGIDIAERALSHKLEMAAEFFDWEIGFLAMPRYRGERRKNAEIRFADHTPGTLCFRTLSCKRTFRARFGMNGISHHSVPCHTFAKRCGYASADAGGNTSYG